MNTNAIADEVEVYLKTKHSRVYRNRRPQNPEFPYVVYRVVNALNSYPSEDVYVNIDIYEDTNKPVRVMEELADSIDGDGKLFDENNQHKEPSGLNFKTIDTDVLNLHFDREARQYVNPEELVSAHLINLRYVVRAYFK